MRGNCEDCTAEMDPPKIAVNIIDMDHGSMTGYYCKLSCAIEDVDATLKHVDEYGTLDDKTPGRFSRSPVMIQDKYAKDAKQGINIAEEKDKVWYDVDTYRRNVQISNDLYSRLEMTLKEHYAGLSMVSETKPETTPSVISSAPLPYKRRNVELGFGGKNIMNYAICYDDSVVWVEFEPPSYNFFITPAAFTKRAFADDVTRHFDAIVGPLWVEAQKRDPENETEVIDEAESAMVEGAE